MESRRCYLGTSRTVLVLQPDDLSKEWRWKVDLIWQLSVVAKGENSGLLISQPLGIWFMATTIHDSSRYHGRSEGSWVAFQGG